MSEAIPVKCKVWRPNAQSYYVETCATHEEIAGSLVADGMDQAEYWPLVVAGYRNTVRWHNDQFAVRVKREYARQWVDRWVEDTELAT